MSIMSIKQLISHLSVYEERADYENLLAVAEQLLLRDPNNAEYILYKLKALDGLGKITQDINLLQHYVNMRSTDETGFVLLYKAYFELGNVGEAIIALIFALSISPDDEECLQLLFNLLQEIDVNFKRVGCNILMLNRLGHLACEIDPFLRENKEQEQNCLNLFISKEGNIANDYLYSLIKCNVHVIESTFWYNLYLTRPLLLNDFFYCQFPYDVNSALRGNTAKAISELGSQKLVAIYQQYPPCIGLPATDISLGYALLQKFGIEKQDNIVCLHVRDSAYLSNKYPQRNFAYHDYRDADIANYLSSVEYLIKQGYKVIRIGEDTNQALDINSTNYVDFCVNKDKKHGDFLEVFLLSICDFFIASASGPASLAAVFDTPTLFSNMTPFHHPYSKYARFIPKRLQQKGEDINFMEICAGRTLSDTTNTAILNALNNEYLLNNDLHYIENTPEEIIAAVKEFDLLVAKRELNTTLTARQQKYYQSLHESYFLKDCPSVVCDSFLEKYSSLFESKSTVESLN